LAGEGSQAYWKILIWAQRLCLTRYYRRCLKGAEAVIFAGGAIFIYKYLELGIRVGQIVSISADLNIPVMFNSVGVEGYDGKSLQARYLKDAINDDIVKVITTRDDLNLLQRSYVTNKKIQTAWTPDSAWWSDRTFAQQIRSRPDNDVIGVGMIRKGIFSDNHFTLTDEELFKFWKNVCDEIKERNLKFEFFTNGGLEDLEFIREFVKRYPQFAGIQVRVPVQPSDLINIISRYSRIIASRMHTSIIAYSLSIPTLSILWNNKIEMFYRQIKHGDRVIDEQKMRDNNAKKIVDQLESISYSDEDSELKEGMRKLTKNYLRNFVDQYVRPGKNRN
jgi:polysaccharide pyruvyl transferase WcaK-like protein